MTDKMYYELKIEQLEKRLKTLQEGFKSSVDEMCEYNKRIDEVVDYLYYYENRLVNSNIQIHRDEIEQLIAILKGEENEESNNNQR